MKKIFILLAIFAVSVTYCHAQTFTISDVTFQNVGPSDMQKKKLLMLGAKVELTFYDSSVILETTTTDNKYTKLVLDKTLNSNVYSYRDGNMTSTLTLYKNLSNSYINSAKFSVSASTVVNDVVYGYVLKRY